MTKIAGALVMELRERTGLGVMDCKKALTEADGDMDAAIEALRKSSTLKAAKKADRTAAEGLLAIEASADGTRAALVEINVETDFAAKNDKFIAFVGKVARLVLSQGDDLTALGLEAERETLVQEIGENVTLRRAVRLSSEHGVIATYLHSDAKKAALVELTGGDLDLGRELAMHVTAMNPMVVKAADVPADVVARQREIFSAQAADSGKPPDIVEKMVEGRVRKFLAEMSLEDQPFVKDSDVKVKKLLADHGAECRRFVRYEVGEGIDRGETDFAAEVAAQVKGAQ